ncbi:MAG: class I SAM-dependent methyltransferase [bacterium]|nr:class I SAM-dependent methyltransferase [bacterium]
MMSSGMIFEDTYQEGENTYHKHVDMATCAYRLTRNGEPVSLEEWNAAVNRLYPMSLKGEHGFPLIRVKEWMRRRSLARLVSASNPRIVADIGSEAGHIVRHFLDGVDKVYCVDLDPHMVDRALTGLASSKVVGCVSGAEAIDLPDASVDVLLAASILEHLADPAAAVREFRRVVRDGGRIVMSVPNDRAITRIKRALQGLRIGWIQGKLARGLAMGHIGVFSLESLRSVAREGGTVLRCGYLLPHFLDLFVVVQR